MVQPLFLIRAWTGFRRIMGSLGRLRWSFGAFSAVALGRELFDLYNWPNIRNFARF